MDENFFQSGSTFVNHQECGYSTKGYDKKDASLKHTDVFSHSINEDCSNDYSESSWLDDVMSSLDSSISDLSTASCSSMNVSLVPITKEKEGLVSSKVMEKVTCTALSSFQTIWGAPVSTQCTGSPQFGMKGTEDQETSMTLTQDRSVNMFHPTPKEIASASQKQAATTDGSYHDYANDPNGKMDVPDEAHRGTLTFPERLHLMLKEAEATGHSNIISWHPHGRSFIVHKRDEFVKKLLPEYFRQTKFTSFQRQLNIYGFSRITTGVDKGGCYHELFLRGLPGLLRCMVRMRLKGISKGGAAVTDMAAPDFYRMSACHETSSVAVRVTSKSRSVVGNETKCGACRPAMAYGSQNEINAHPWIRSALEPLPFPRTYHQDAALTNNDLRATRRGTTTSTMTRPDYHPSGLTAILERALETSVDMSSGEIVLG